MSSMRRTLALAGLTLIVAGCASQPRSTSSSGSAPSPQASKGGGYYQNDGPPDDENIDLASIPDAIPRDEPHSRYGNPASYEALGKTYYVLPSAAGFTQTGRASWYGKQFHGRRTSSGEPYNMFKMTAAHKRLPIPSYVRVTNLDTGKQVIVRVNDRGPFHDGRIIDLSYVAARRLDVVAHGSVPVRIETVTPATLKAEKNTSNRPAQRVSASQPYRRQSKSNSRAASASAPVAPASSAQNTPGRAIKVANRTAANASGASAPANASGTLYLQTGAFGNPDNAQRLRQRLQNAGFQQVTVVESSGATTIYRVQLGPYANERSRALNRQILREQGFSAQEVDR